MESYVSVAMATPRNFFAVTPEPFRLAVPVFGKTRTVEVHQSTDEAAFPGGRLWDLGVLLAKCLVDPKTSPVPLTAWSRTTVVELGAGVGLTGLAAATLGAQCVVLTDLPVVVDAVTAPNVARNTEHYKVPKGFAAKVHARPLTWGNKAEIDATLALTGGAPQLLVAGDVGYQHSKEGESHFEVFIETACALAGPSTVFLFGNRIRMEGSKDLISGLYDRFEAVRDPISAEQVDKSFGAIKKHNISIHFLRLRQPQGSHK